MESSLALYLFGLPRIEREGEPVKLDRRKALALVAYLAVTGQSHRRDSLVNLLWPEYDSSRGRAALRRTLYALRDTLGTDWLNVDREQIGLEPSCAPWVDVDQFRQHLAACETHGHPNSDVCPNCITPLTNAVQLVRGEFMSGFGLKDSANFDDWQLLQAEHLRRELDGALQRLVHWYTTERHFEPAVGYARRRLSLDPLDEQAHRHLMRLYTWSGRRSAALRQYQECVAILGDQLGIPPQENTTELFQAIQEGQAPPLLDERQAPDTLAPPERQHEPPAFLEKEIAIESPLFVARVRELAQLDQHLQAALSGTGKAIFVTGDAGAGKTAIIQEFTRRAQGNHADLVVAGGHCNAQTGLGDPYLPFREILGLLTGDVEAQWTAGAMTREQALRLWSTLPLAAQVLVETGPDLIGTFISGTALLSRARAIALGGERWLTRLDEQVKRRPVTGVGVAGPQRSDLFEQYARVMQDLTQERPVVLVLDDLQWADLGSISLLFHLGRQLTSNRVLIVGAYRPEEVALGRMDPQAGLGQRERHPLEPVVHELQRDLGDIIVNLGQEEGREFVQALLQSEPNRLDDAFREMLYRQTRGHPLFTIELLRGLQEQGDLVRDQEGYWIEGTALDWDRLPARVEAVIAERIGRLAQPLRAALRVASVEGELFTAEVVAQIQATDQQEILRRFSRELDRKHRLVRAQSIQRTSGQLVSQYRFRHGLFQRYLYNGLDPVERVHLHSQVGTVLEKLHGVQDRLPTADVTAIAPQLARHFQQARNVEKTIHYLHQAGERAVQLCAYRDAIAHLTEELALLVAQRDLPERARQELALQLALGMAWVGSEGYGPEAQQAFSRAHDLGRQTGATSELCRAAAELSILYYVWAEHAKALELAEEALRLASQTGDPLLVAVTHTYMGFVLFALGEYTRARDHLAQMIAFYDPGKHHRAVVVLRGSDVGLSALAYDACCLWCLGYPEQAERRSEEALVLAREQGHAFTLADIHAFAGCLFNQMRQDAHGSPDSAAELKRLATEKVPGWLGEATWYWGRALAMQGHLEDGIAVVRQGLDLQQQGSERCYRTGGYYALARAQEKAGRPDDGLSTLTEALAQVNRADERYLEAEIHRLRGELQLAQGDESEAETSLSKAIEVARRQQAKSWELRATTSLARLWRTQSRTDEAWQVLAEVYGWFTEGFDMPDLIEAKALLDELA